MVLFIELWPELAMNLQVGAPVSQTKLSAVTTAAIAACDALDSVVDGVISDPQPLHAAENPTNPATFTRPLCPFPEVARYKSSGDPNDAANFVCVGEHYKHDDDRD